MPIKEKIFTLVTLKTTIHACLLSLLLIFTSKNSFAAFEDTDSTLVSKPIEDFNIFLVPIVFRLPETGFAGGIASTATMRLFNTKKESKPAQISAGISYTQLNQLLFQAPFNMFLKDDKYFLNGEIGWFRYLFSYFGISNRPVAEELYDVTFPRIRIFAGQQIAKGHYLGAKIWYENFNMKSVEPNGELANGSITGSDGSITSALGFGYTFDSRDHIFYPRNGAFVNIYTIPSLKILGATHNFHRLQVEAARYFTLNKKVVLANQLIFSAIQGNEIPFNQLVFLGGSRNSRGIWEGKFRDRNGILSQHEARFELTERIGVVAFASAAFLGNTAQFLRTNTPYIGFGGGLRLKVLKNDHVNARFDFGYSPQDGSKVYIMFSEAF
jgi:hypothetical protein